MSHMYEVFMRMKERAVEAELMAYIETVDSTLAPILYRSACSMMDGFEFELEDGVYAQRTREFNERQTELAISLISDLPANILRHQTLHCISFKECMSTVIGLNLNQFGQLLAFVDEPLKRAFPRSPARLELGQPSNFPERRFKLFLCLFRLKQGVTFALMETVFGWGRAAIQEWFAITVEVLEANLRSFHRGFLQYKGADWQANECNKWRYKHILDQSYDSYLRKVAFQNSESTRNGGQNTIDATRFIGSIGAVDGTYCVQPRFGRQTLIAGHEDPTLDKMYTGYKRCHAYKILLISSHGINEPKFLLWVEAACGSAPDASVLASIAGDLEELLVPEAAMLGDHAFHGCKRVVAGYTTAQVVVWSSPNTKIR